MELSLTLSHKQVLSPNMQLAVKILQMDYIELEQYVRESALDNPLIELEDAKTSQTDGEPPSGTKEIEWLDFMDSGPYPRSARSDSDMPLYEKAITDNLSETLIMQLPGFHLEESVERRVRFLIDCLDKNGYIAVERSQLLGDLGIDDSLLDEAICVLHNMDPPGVGAFSLRECLCIQARRGAGASPVLIKLINNYLDILAKNQLGKIAKSMSVSLGDVIEARRQLLLLNPKPGNGYASHHDIPYVRPDIYIIPAKEGFQAVLNDFGQPRITINSYYQECARHNAETADYINEKLRSAERLISNVQRRKDTIQKCVDSILKRQMDFFEKGPGYLLPMTLNDVSGDLNMHPSTICRATRGKYLQCQWGVLELSKFFSRRLGDGSICNEDQTQDSIQMQIKRLVANENPESPLSDNEIALCLRQKEIHIARRTVAKYREQMGLPAASRRKKY